LEFTFRHSFATLGSMKKFLCLALLPLLLTGCESTLTNLTPQRQVRNPDNQYMVEVAFASKQQTLRWHTIRPQIVVGQDVYPMHPTKLMTNRWEGLIPVPPTTSLVHYHYRFDFEYNSMGHPQSDNAISPEYSLQIVEPAP
jgi:hypothetical protein